ncbi:MAG: hypothetical protein ACI4HQ_03065 [Acetatifactor sp.]
MAFWDRLFKRKRKRDKNPEDWESIVYDREDVDFRNEEQRSRYITNCLEQISEATKEMNLLSGEYSLVTSYLTDMEEIEALPETEREKLNSIATRLLTVERECERYHDKKNRMSDSEYAEIRRQEGEIPEGIRKLRECEDYNQLVKQDLKRLDRERQAFEYRRTELETMLDNFRGMVVIIFTAFIICMILLVTLQFGFEMNTRAGYLLTVGAAAVAETVLMVKYTDRERELQRVAGGINKLVQLQNKVKIRYVNNSNLLEYLRIKYSVDSADILEDLWTRYLQEKEERKEYAEAEAKMDYYRKQLVAQMNNYHITDPVRWQDQPGALLDKREMVEIRHELILRRQALRKQMDYNTDVAETAKSEIMDIANRYPDYAAEILDMVNKYE